MELIIDIDDELGEVLQANANDAGLSVEDYVMDLIIEWFNELNQDRV